MKKTLAIIKYNMKRLLSDKTSLIFALLMPIGFFILMSFMFQNPDQNMGDFLISAMIPNFLIIIISNAIFNLFGVLLVDTISTGNMTKYKLLGISQIKFATLLFIAVLVIELVVSTIFLGYVSLVAKISVTPANMLSTAVMLFILHIFQFGITYLLTSLISKSSTYNGISMTIFMFQMFTGGLTFPITMFPEKLQTILKFINPMSIASVGMQNVWLLGNTLKQELPTILIILGISVAYIIIGLLVNIYKKKSLTAKAY